MRNKMEVRESVSTDEVDIQYLKENGIILHQSKDERSTLYTDHKFVYKYYKPRKGLIVYNNIIKELSKFDNHNILLPNQIITFPHKSKIIEISNYYKSDLFSYIENTDRIEAYVLDSIIKQCLNTIDFMHNICNIAHRDIKPENILITFNDYKPIIKFIDLDFCCFTDDNELFHGGSLSYASPELLLGPALLDWKKIDVWAFGVLIHILLFITFPWKEATNNDKFYNTYTNYKKPEQYWIDQLNHFDYNINKKTMKYVYILKNSLNISPKNRADSEYLLKILNT